MIIIDEVHVSCPFCDYIATSDGDLDCHVEMEHYDEAYYFNEGE